jgi:hypothetical protein
MAGENRDRNSSTVTDGLRRLFATVSPAFGKFRWIMTAARSTSKGFFRPCLRCGRVIQSTWYPRQFLSFHRDLCIRRFTPPAEKLFNLIPSDVGRPISDIRPNLLIEDLASGIAKVIDTLTPLEREVQTKDKHWYSLRIRPYVTLDNKIDGASIVLLDIDTIKQHLEKMKHERGG